MAGKKRVDHHKILAQEFNEQVLNESREIDSFIKPWKKKKRPPEPIFGPKEKFIDSWTHENVTLYLMIDERGKPCLTDGNYLDWLIVYDNGGVAFDGIFNFTDVFLCNQERISEACINLSLEIRVV